MAGQRVNAMRRIPDQRHTRRHRLRHPHQLERKPCRRGHQLQPTQLVGACIGHTLGQRRRALGQEVFGNGFGCRPHHRDHATPVITRVGDISGQGQISQHAILAEPLIGRPKMRQFGAEIRHHPEFIVGIMLATQADLLTHPRVTTICTHQ